MFGSKVIGSVFLENIGFQMNGETDRVEIIAEIAQGYEGNDKLAELLTTAAIKSGANAVKFQLVYADELATPDYVWYDLFKSLEMQERVWKKISDRVHESGLLLYFDIFGFRSLKTALRIGADGVKLSTTEFYNHDLMQEALQKFDRVTVSVGGIPEADIDQLVGSLPSNCRQKICLIYGFQAEPTPLEHNNLLKLRTLSEKYQDFKIGFMDHSDGSSKDAFNVALIALGMGVQVIEKHITLDHSLEIEDFVSGLSADRFKKFSRQIRRYEKALGHSSLDLSPLELEYREKAVKLVVATDNIKAGSVINAREVALKRTGQKLKGKPIRALSDVVGKKIKADIKLNDPIYRDQI